jgi:hypothetical protein
MLRAAPLRGVPLAVQVAEEVHEASGALLVHRVEHLILRDGVAYVNFP